MKTLIFILSIIILSFVKSSDSKVYVCNSNTSIAYHHNFNCRGLQKCTHQIIIVTVENAQKMGKRQCKLCYGK